MDLDNYLLKKSTEEEISSIVNSSIYAEIKEFTILGIIKTQKDV